MDRSDGLTEQVAEYRGRVAELDADGMAAAMHLMADLQEAQGRAGYYYADAALLGEHRGPQRGALMMRLQERSPRSPPSWSSSSWNAAVDESHVDVLLADPGAGLLRASPALHAPLPRPHAQRVPGAAAHREVGQRGQRLGAAVRRADLGHHGRPARVAAGRRGRRAHHRAPRGRPVDAAAPDRDVRRAVARGHRRTERSRTSSAGGRGCRGSTPSSFPARTTPGSRPKTWSKRNSPGGPDRHDLAGEVRRARLAVAEEYGSTIISQFKRMGYAFDWIACASRWTRATRTPCWRSSSVGSTRARSTEASVYQLVSEMPYRRLRHRGGV